MKTQWVLVLAAALLMVGGVVTVRAAEEKKEEKGSSSAKIAKVDGTWKWSFARQDGQTTENTLKLKREGEKLTGKLTGGRGGEVEISDGKIGKDGTIAFTVTREFNGRSFTQKYEGKVEGETIKGKITGERQGQSFSRDWEAKRSNDVDVTGTWKFERTNDNGQTFTATLKLKQEGGKVTGTTQWADNEPVEITEGKVDGNKLSFKVTREQNGEKWTATYSATVEEEAIKGTVTATNAGGEERSFELEYEKVKE